jgi:hypothetical protein
MVLAPASPDVLHKLIAAAFVGESPSHNRQSPRPGLTDPTQRETTPTRPTPSSGESSFHFLPSDNGIASNRCLAFRGSADSCIESGPRCSLTMARSSTGATSRTRRMVSAGRQGQAERLSHHLTNLCSHLCTGGTICAERTAITKAVVSRQ